MRTLVSAEMLAKVKPRFPTMAECLVLEMGTSNTTPSSGVERGVDDPLGVVEVLKDEDDDKGGGVPEVLLAAEEVAFDVGPALEDADEDPLPLILSSNFKAAVNAALGSARITTGVQLGSEKSNGEYV